MSPRLWIPVAVLGLAGGVGVAMLTSKLSSEDVESAALLPSSVEPSIDGSAAAATSNVEDSAVDGGEAGSGVESQTASADVSDGAGVDTLTEQSLTSVDRTLPAFSLPALDDTEWTPESLKGKPWVINFWATWCPPCIEEIPSMNAAYAVLEPQGIGMLAINAGEGALAVEVFLQRIAIDFPNVLGEMDTLSNWSVKALPTTIVVDADGRVIYEALGPREWDDEALLQHVIDLL